MYHKWHLRDWGWFVLLTAAATLLPRPGWGEEQAPLEKEARGEQAAKYLRIRRDEDGKGLALETAVVQLTGQHGGQPVQVDLVGAVHVGEKNYYQALNRLFKQYDTVLFELIAPEGTRVPVGAKLEGGSPVSSLQQGMKTLLGLEFQLEQVDYSPENLVHADLSPTQFMQSMKDRNESFTKIFFRMMGQGMAMQAKDAGRSNDLQLLSALFSKNRELKMKQAMAEQFENMEGQVMAFNGPTGSTIITERNKKALDVLKQELKAGKRRVAIFYGAGHLPDMEQRLVRDYKLRRAAVKWLPAWDLTRVIK